MSNRNLFVNVKYRKHDLTYPPIIFLFFIRSGHKYVYSNLELTKCVKIREMLDLMNDQIMN